MGFIKIQKPHSHAPQPKRLHGTSLLEHPPCTGFSSNREPLHRAARVHLEQRAPNLSALTLPISVNSLNLTPAKPEPNFVELQGPDWLDQLFVANRAANSTDPQRTADYHGAALMNYKRTRHLLFTCNNASGGDGVTAA